MLSLPGLNRRLALPVRFLSAARPFSRRAGALSFVVLLAAALARPARAQVWEARYNGDALAAPPTARYEGESIAVDGNGDAVVTGSASADGSENSYDALTIKYDGATGKQVWVKRYNGPANRNDFASCVVTDAQNNVVITGYSRNATADVSDTDYVTVKYNGATGAQVWVKRYSGPGAKGDYPKDLAVTASGDVVVTGSSTASDGATNDAATIKYNGATGTVLWDARYNGTGDGNDSGDAVAVDAGGNVFIAGAATNTLPNSPRSVLALRYNGSSGTQMWAKQWFASDNVFGADIALDSNGDPYVAASVTMDSNPHCALLKYNRATGAIRWEAVYAQSGSSYEYVCGVGVDAQNNVVVGGEAGRGVGAATSYFAVKYEGLTGARLWEATYAAGYYSGAKGLAVDADGNAFVTGYTSDDDDAANDGVTVKFDSATGARQAVYRYRSSPAALRVYANAVAVDASGDAFVTGRAHLRGVITLKYAGGTAPPLAAGFAASDIARGNGVTPGASGLADADLRVLWGKPSAALAQVWSAPPGGGGTVSNYTPLLGAASYVPVAVSVSPATNKSALLWNQTTGADAGRAALWILPQSLGAVETGTAYGPLAGGWTVIDQQTGGDNKVRMLWRQTGTGKLAAWRLNATGSAIEIGGYITAPAGYTLIPQIAVSPSDNKIRIAWAKTAAPSEIAVWTLNAALTGAESGRTYAANGYQLRGFGIGVDNKVRLVWESLSNLANLGLWTLPANGANNVIENARAVTLGQGTRTARARVSPGNHYLLLVVPADPGATAPPYAEAWVVSPNAQTVQSVTPLGGG